MRVLWNSCAKTFGKLSEKKYIVKFPFNRVAWTLSTAYHQSGLETNSGSAQKGNDVLKFQNFKNKSLRNFPFFSNTSALQYRIFDFTLHKKWSFPLRISSVNATKSVVSFFCAVSVNTDFKKKFSFEYSEIVGSLPENSIQTQHVYATLKRRGNDRFHVVSTWNTRGVLVGKVYNEVIWLTKRS